MTESTGTIRKAINQLRIARVEPTEIRCGITAYKSILAEIDLMVGFAVDISASVTYYGLPLILDHEYPHDRVHVLSANPDPDE